MARRETVLAATLGAAVGLAVLAMAVWLWLGAESPSPATLPAQAATGPDNPAALPLLAPPTSGDAEPAPANAAAPGNTAAQPPANQPAGRVPPPSLPPPIIDRVAPSEGEGDETPRRPHAPSLVREAEMAHLDMQTALHILKAALR
ncbi:MAG: hypothetical protein IT463_00430 [Planctomycetes bacterium]|nr:hypothetical protein [Planctomycetota bacterium]